MYLIFSNEDLHVIIKIVKSLEDAGFLIKGVTETVEKEVNEKSKGFQLLSGTLASGLLRNMLSGKVVIRAFHGKLLELLKSKELLQFFNSFFMTYVIVCSARGYHSHLIFCDQQDTMSYQRSLLSSLTIFVTYRTSHHTRGHHSHFPSNSYPGQHRISPGVASILRMCFCQHSQFTCNQFNQ